MVINFVGDWVPVGSRNNREWNGFSVGNLECAFERGQALVEKAYSSVLPHSSIERIASGGFSALSVANNHVNDAGDFKTVFTELTQRFPDVQFFGVKEKPFAEFEKDGKRIVVIGCLESCRSRGNFILKQEEVTALIRKIRLSQGGASGQTLIFIYPHWGMEGEYTRYPSPMQMSLAHEWIDEGADGIIGNHSHVPQGKETYHGKSIYYSLGNYDFPLGEINEVPQSYERMIVRYDDNDMRWSEEFDSSETAAAVAAVSAEIADGWTIWKWATVIGSFNIQKNMASWKIRLKKDFIKTFPKFIVWQFLPKIVLFRIASICKCYKK